jgi:hypothetical protein
MPWYIRKYINFGPLRVNLSKSGLGYSFGVRGARIATGPHGSYIHLGRYGVYYRKSLGTPSVPPPPKSPPKVPLEPVRSLPREDYVADADKTDSSADELLSEIRRRHALWSYFHALLLSSALLIFGLLTLGSPWWVLWSTATLAIAGSLYLRRLDTRRKRINLQFHLDGGASEAYETLLNGFEGASRASRIWQILTKASTFDPKYNAGANQLTNRNVATLKRAIPPFVKSNVSVWGIFLNEHVWYFFPDRVLVYGRKHVGTVSYLGMDVTCKEIEFVEDSPIPSDAKVVGNTWKYTNRSGGPDRRFSVNPSMPIALYAQLDIFSQIGGRITLQSSNVAAAKKFCSALDGYTKSSHLGGISLAAPSEKSKALDRSESKPQFLAVPHAGLSNGRASMFCMKCGNRLPDDANYCPGCGTQRAGLAPHRDDASPKGPPSEMGSMPLAQRAAEVIDALASPLKEVLDEVAQGEPDETMPRDYLITELKVIFVSLAALDGNISVEEAREYRTVFSQLEPAAFEGIGVIGTVEMLKDFIGKNKSAYSVPSALPLTVALLRRYDGVYRTDFSEKLVTIMIEVAELAATANGKASQRQDAGLEQLRTILEGK